MSENNFNCKVTFICPFAHPGEKTLHVSAGYDDEDEPCVLHEGKEGEFCQEFLSQEIDEFLRNARIRMSD